ncbi:MAG: hypothetical protein ACXVA7_22720, partial [Isosphaeraceae bacterium]
RAPGRRVDDAGRPQPLYVNESSSLIIYVAVRLDVLSIPLTERSVTGELRRAMRDNLMVEELPFAVDWGSENLQ